MDRFPTSDTTKLNLMENHCQAGSLNMVKTIENSQSQKNNMNKNFSFR